MRLALMKYHEVMFYLWYGKNSVMRDYHGRKYHQAQSLPTVAVSSGLRFRSCKRDVILAVQCVSITAFFMVIALGLLAQCV